MMIHMLAGIHAPLPCVRTRQDDGHDFGMDRASVRDLITSALPLARGSTENFWLTFVEQEQEMLYPLELFAALALECHGLSRCEMVDILFLSKWHCSPVLANIV